MNKKIRRIILILVITFIISPISVFAADCDNILNLTSDFEYYKNAYDSNCSGEYRNPENDDKCIDYALKIDSIGTELTNLYHKKGISEQCKTKIEPVVKKANCELLLKDVYSIAKGVIKYIYIIAPILLIIFVGVDLFKILTSGGDGKVNSKIKSAIFKRLIAFLLLFMVPTIIKFIISLNESEYNLEGDYYYCDYVSEYKGKPVSESTGN